MRTGAEDEKWALAGRPLWTRTFLVFLLALAFFAFLYAPSPLIYDADSYFHLAVARGYASEGISRQLKWVRFGLLAEQFGDKEFLFHGLLVPFAAWMDPSVGGRLALGLLGAAVLSVVGYLSMRAIGPWGAIIPFWLVVGSLEFIWRLVRLRAELLALVILLLALWMATRRRYLWLGILALLYALAYTAIHAFVGLFLLIFLAHAWAFDRWEWRLFAYPLVGAGIGLLIHPQFPDNLVVWWFQSVEFFRFKGALDVGTEFTPMRTDVLLIANLGWLLGLLLLWRASTKVANERGAESSVTFGVATAVFGLLYLQMSRFAVYLVVLATLWLLFEIRRQGREVSPWVRLPWRGRIGLTWAWILCFLVSLPIAGYDLRRYRARNGPGPENARIVDRQQFSETLPDGARVAAPWRSTPIYMFWAPQGRYLNVLDPVFLAAVDSTVHRAQSDLFADVEPDAPLVAASVLNSEYIAYSKATGSATLTRRLLADPRIEAVHSDINVLFRIRAPQPSPFVLDWKVVPSDVGLPPPGDSGDDWAEYPRLRDARLRSLEGYVDARRVVAPGECLGLVHTRRLASDRDLVLELAATGPTILWVDELERAHLLEGDGGRLGSGSLLSLNLSAGEHRFTVLTCPDLEAQRSGFYLVERQESSSSLGAVRDLEGSVVDPIGEPVSGDALAKDAVEAAVVQLDVPVVAHDTAL